MSRLLLAIVIGAGACSAHSLDYLSVGASAEPALPADAALAAPDPVRRPPPDAGRPPDSAALPTPTPTPPPAPVEPPRADGGSDAPPMATDAAAATVYLIVGAQPLSAGDSALDRLLRGRGLHVMVVVDNVLNTVDTASASLVIISETTAPGRVGARFRDVARPVIVAEPLLYDDMGMVDATVAVGQNRDLDRNVSTLRIDSPGDPLAVGLQGNVAVVNVASEAGWGTPNAAATRIASLLGAANKVALFTYEAGALMPELVAPARRVGLFVSDQAAPVLNRNGAALLDAAITWALSR